MKVTDVVIRNYKSLHRVELSQLGNLVVLIGKNSSGKTNILELLNRFFAEIDITGATQGIDQYSWFDGDQEVPIEVTVSISLDDEEYSAIFPAELRRIVENKVKDHRRVTITRLIVKPPTGWQSKDIIWAELYLTKDGKIATPEMFGEILSYQIRVVGFTPDASKENISGNVLVLVDPAKKAYLLGPYADALIKAGKAQWENVSKKTTDFKKYAKDEGYELVEKPFTENELWALCPFSQQALQTAISAITAKVKNRFKILLSTRDAWPQNPLVRSPLLDGEAQNLLRTVGVGESRMERRRWRRIKSLFEESFDTELVIHPNYIAAEKQDLRLPIQNVGGGSQEFLILLRHLTEGDFLFGIEEPELHFHPELGQKLFEILKTMSEGNQIFLSTHSTIFVDRAELSNTWIVRLEGKKTEARRIEHPDDLRRILLELGSRPSDIFFSNALVFVEGDADRTVYPIWAEKIGLDSVKANISWFPTHGKNRGKYHLGVWVDVAKTTDLPYYMILDKGAESEAKEFIGRGLIRDRNLFLLRKSSLEEYYPRGRLLDAFKKEYGIGDGEEESIITKLDDKEIRELIRKKGGNPTGWKTVIGKTVAETMTVNEIDDEIQSIFGKIVTALRLIQKG